jgi:hypothetical protein
MPLRRSISVTSSPPNPSGSTDFILEPFCSRFQCACSVSSSSALYGALKQVERIQPAAVFESVIEPAVEDARGRGGCIFLNERASIQIAPAQHPEPSTFPPERDAPGRIEAIRPIGRLRTKTAAANLVRLPLLDQNLAQDRMTEITSPIWYCFEMLILPFLSFLSSNLQTVPDI